jgi:hypothetical protein
LESESDDDIPLITGAHAPRFWHREDLESESESEDDIPLFNCTHAPKIKRRVGEDPFVDLTMSEDEEQEV